jgi:hypothetical protein
MACGMIARIAIEPAKRSGHDALTEWLSFEQVKTDPHLGNGGEIGWKISALDGCSRNGRKHGGG